MVEIRHINDIEELMAWRAEVISNVFGEDADAGLLDANRRYYLRHAADGTHIALVASLEGVDCGCGALCLSDELPSPDNPSGKCAYLMNIYVRETFRNRGVAHTIVSRLIEEAKTRNCGKIYLETTAEGKPVYISLGFRDMADMMKYYDTENQY
ncbi:MAG: GNAT family N-acetyltransferase [Muribaculaceae bacterium]|nr:GNAT family N-acetyltransferase [Muribaculaceae bacterium]